MAAPLQACMLMEMAERRIKVQRENDAHRQRESGRKIRGKRERDRESRLEERGVGFRLFNVFRFNLGMDSA